MNTKTGSLVETSLSRTKRMTGIGIFMAVVVVLSFVATYIKFGPFEITLALSPMVIGAAMYGAGAGAALGFGFGAVVLFAAVSGASPGSNVLWAVNPALTALIIFFKSSAAGFAAGVVYKLISKKNVYAAVICAAVICPIINTGIFSLSMIFLYRETLTTWAAGTDAIYFALFGLTGVNFLLEMAVNVVLSPMIARVIRTVKR